MNLSQKINLASDRVIQLWLREIDAQELTILMCYHLDDKANKCILRNMSQRASDLIQSDLNKTKDLIHDYEKIFDTF